MEHAKNLLILCIDSWRHDCLQAHTDKQLLGPLATQVRTRHFDKLASEGIRFARAYTSAPVTTPAHASLFSGTHWTHHGAYHLTRTPVSKNVTMLAEILADHGFETGMNAGMGKDCGLMFADHHIGLSRGFRHQAFGVDTRPATWQWLRQVRGQRWFLFFHTMAVHLPYGMHHRRANRLLQRALAKDDFSALIRAYVRCLRRVDDELGRLFGWLREAGEFDKTLIVLLADHGEGFSRQCDNHGPYGGWREPVAHIPLVMQCPSLLPAGRVISQPVSMVDILPTVLELLHCDPPSHSQLAGRSLTPLWLKGERDVARTLYFAGHSISFVTPEPFSSVLWRDKLKFVRLTESPEYLRLIREEVNRKTPKGRRRDVTGCHALTIMEDLLHHGESRRIYDVVEDPWETTNLVDAHPCEREEFEQELERHARDASNLLPAESREDTAQLEDRLRGLGYF